ncbi:hypothetical protein [Paraburkholderia sp. BCC1886]|uniref:hypothetical protein n=1 Tax=Paraburkholderia sp. BCC1886 TaxID=2562670 RepID=UPI0011836A3F|nr:hypothetical protein [Paraburkholderia sp. BCC1886]
MLNEKELMSSLPLTERLDAAGYALHPVGGTPLEALVAASRSDSGLYDMAQGNVGQLVVNIGVMANKQQPFLGCAEHDVVLDDIVATACDAVKNHIAVARGVVAPVVKDLYSRVSDSLGELTRSSLLGMEVEVQGEPKPLNNGALQAAIRKFERVSFDSPSLSLALPDMTVSELAELAGSGSGSLDGDVAEWLAAKGDGFLSRVWKGMFQQGSDAKFRNFAEWVGDRVEGVDVALAVFLFTRKLFEGKPMEGTNMSLANYRGVLAEFRDQAGATLCRALDKVERSVRSGILVRDIVGAKTVVYEPVYRQFLEAGGTNEMLFANALTMPLATSLDAILAKKDQLATRWNTHTGITKTAEANKRFNKAKELLNHHFRAQLSDHIDGADGFDHNRDLIVKLFNEQLALVTLGDLDDLYNLCLKLVCRSRYFQTDAERILGGIDRAKRENPTLSVREAATVSIVDYIAFWVASMLRIQHY